MSAALAIDCRFLVQELYEVLNELDSASWRAEFQARSRERLAHIRAELERLLETVTATDGAPGEAGESGERFPRLAARLRELAQHMESHLPTLDRTALAELARSSASPDSAEATVRARWMNFREAMTPRYEAVVEGLKRHSVYAPSLRTTNYTRNGFHVCGAAFTVTAIQLIPDAAWLPVIASVMAATAWGAELSRRVSPVANEAMMWLFQKVSHPHERTGVNSATWFVTALLAVSLMGDPMAMTLGVIALGVGDPLAAIVGRRFGRVRLVNGRSLEGSLAFLFSVALVGTACRRALYPATAPLAACAIAVAAGAAGAATELLSRRLDDNLTIPVVTSAVALLVANLL